MRFDAARSTRDTCLGAAAVTLAVGHLLGVCAGITYFTSDWFSPLVAAGVLVPVCGMALLVVGLAVIAVAFFARDAARAPRLRLGALVVAGGYGAFLVGRTLSLISVYGPPFHLPPAWILTSMITQALAFVPAVAAALLAATAFGRLRANPGMQAEARNRLLGWASVGFGVEFALLLLSSLFNGWPIWGTLSLRALAYCAAIAAAVVAATGFFGAERDCRFILPSTLARRDRTLAIAALLFLLYRLLGLAHVDQALSWLWALDEVALTIAALWAAVGFTVSRRSLLRRDLRSPTASAHRTTSQGENA